MNYKKSLKLVLTSLLIVLSIYVAFAESEPCEICVEPCSILTIPVATDNTLTIEGITIKAGFDQNLLEATGATLNGGILENKGYDLLVNTENAGKITLVIYAKDDSVTGIGNIAFITFKVKCTLTTSSLITLEKISPATGGFFINESICQSFIVDCMNIRTANPSEITETTAVSGGDIIHDGGENVFVRGICWSTLPNPTIADNKTENGSGEGEFIASMTGLTPGTKYYVRAYSTNSVYTGYGNQKVFTTIPSAPIAEEASDITETCFIANWHPAKGADFYKLDFSETDNFNTVKTLISNGNCQTIGGLIRGKKYFYRVRAVNASGSSKNSAVKNLTTKTTVSECDIKGDVNCDNSVDIADAILTLKTLAGMCGCGIFTGADVNGDKKIGFEELLYILQDISDN